MIALARTLALVPLLVLALVVVTSSCAASEREKIAVDVTDGTQTAHCDDALTACPIELSIAPVVADEFDVDAELQPYSSDDGNVFIGAQLAGDPSIKLRGATALDASLHAALDVEPPSNADQHATLILNVATHQLPRAIGNVQVVVHITAAN